MDTKRIITYLRSSLDFARAWSESDGRMRDPFETEYGENFSPACFAVIAAALFRLEGRAEDREWMLRWGRRSAGIMREAPGLRDYMLGYLAMIFPLLGADPALEELREDWLAASHPPEEPSPWVHIIALQVNGDLLCPRGPESLARAEVLVSQMEALWTEAGFPEDQASRDDGSIPHAYLTVACLAILRLARPEGATADLVARIQRLIIRACDWFERINGPAFTAAQANRSYNQLWVYPLYALVAWLQRGPEAGAVVARCLDTVERATDRLRRPNFLPNALSAYAAAGNEHYNRVNNDVGAGGVGWALLAVLQAAGEPALAQTPPPAVGTFVDAAAGYAAVHGPDSGVLLVTKAHRWGYHLPLQPAWLTVGGDEGPFIGAKRSGVNNPYGQLVAAPDRVPPLLEPYAGLLLMAQDRTFQVMQEPVEQRTEDTWACALRPLGQAATDAVPRLAVTVAAKSQTVTLTYALEGEITGEAWLTVPVRLWDGRQELRYRLAGGEATLEWSGRTFTLSARTLDGAALPGAWRLRRERSIQTGFGVTGNFALALGAARKIKIQLQAQ